MIWYSYDGSKAIPVLVKITFNDEWWEYMGISYVLEAIYEIHYNNKRSDDKCY